MLIITTLIRSGRNARLLPYMYLSHVRAIVLVCAKVAPATGRRASKTQHGFPRLLGLVQQYTQIPHSFALLPGEYKGGFVCFVEPSTRWIKCSMYCVLLLHQSLTRRLRSYAVSFAHFLLPVTLHWTSIQSSSGRYGAEDPSSLSVSPGFCLRVTPLFRLVRNSYVLLGWVTFRSVYALHSLQRVGTYLRTHCPRLGSTLHK